MCSSNWTGSTCSETVQWNVTSPTDFTFTSIVHYSTSNYPSFSTAILKGSSPISTATDGDGLKLHPSANCRNCGLAIFVACMIATASVIVHLFFFVHLNAKRQKQRHREKQFGPSQLTSSSDWN